MRSLDFMILNYIFFSRKMCLQSQYVLTVVTSWGITYHLCPPEDSYCVVNGPPKRVYESLDKARIILCQCISFLEKRSMAFRPHIWSLYMDTGVNTQMLGEAFRGDQPQVLTPGAHPTIVCYGFRGRKTPGTSQLGRFQEKEGY